jgi:peptidoglycan hydrolase-like protein with peptidoglycan-binding domain
MTAGRRRLVIVMAVGLGVLALAGAGVAVWRPAAGPTQGPRAVATTTVTRETLVDVTTVPGKLAYGPEQAVESRLTGTVTWVPAVGTTVDRGKTLFRVDDKPVVLLFGTVPAYRVLTAGHAAASPPPGTGAGSGTGTGTGTDAGGAGGASGPAVPATKGADVRQFEENLRALGYAGFTVDDQFNGRTAAAVRRWQKDLGLEQTGDVELGRVFYVRAAVRVAKLKLTAGALTSGPVLTFTGTIRLITATIKEYEKELAKVATKVTVALPSGKEVGGTVTAVNTPSDDQGTAAGDEPNLEVVVALDDQAAVNGLDDGPARVRLVAEERKDVLVVPVGALLALAEGGYGLQVVDGGSTRIVAVTTGLFANGKVEVGGSDIRDGMIVEVAQ